jgi:small subunit ribosomal protein S16
MHQGVIDGKSKEFLVVKIRVKRAGGPKKPHYRIVVVDSRNRRDGMPIEEIGYYNPRSKELKINKEAVEKWTKTGAQPSEIVASLLKREATAAAPDMAKAN